jgi:excisionase family DNA binding protein
MTDTLESRASRPAKKLVRAEDKLLLSRQEAAALLSISQRSLDYLIANKVLMTRRIGSRVLIPAHDLHRFARADHPQRLAGSAVDLRKICRHQCHDTLTLRQDRASRQLLDCAPAQMSIPRSHRNPLMAS